MFLYVFSSSFRILFSTWNTPNYVYQVPCTLVRGQTSITIFNWMLKQFALFSYNSKSVRINQFNFSYTADNLETEGREGMLWWRRISESRYQYKRQLWMQFVTFLSNLIQRSIRHLKMWIIYYPHIGYWHSLHKNDFISNTSYYLITAYVSQIVIKTMKKRWYDYLSSTTIHTRIHRVLTMECISIGVSHFEVRMCKFLNKFIRP